MWDRILGNQCDGYYDEYYDEETGELVGYSSSNYVVDESPKCASETSDAEDGDANDSSKRVCEVVNEVALWKHRGRLLMTNGTPWIRRPFANLLVAKLRRRILLKMKLSTPNIEN